MTAGSVEKETLRSLMDPFKGRIEAVFKVEVCGHYVDNMPFDCVQIPSELHKQYIPSGVVRMLLFFTWAQFCAT